MGLQIAMVIVGRQLHQIVEQIHDCHHGEHSLLAIELMFVVLFNEWSREQMGLSTQHV
jgi:hypothetical protein